jgi:hypothetical protein
MKMSGNKLDLMNLPDELRFGKLIKEDKKGVSVVLPMCVIDFAALAEMTRFEDNDPAFTATAIFNAGNPKEPCHVDLTKTIYPAIKKFAAHAGVDLAKARFPLFTNGKRFTESGEEYQGYFDWSTRAKFNNKNAKKIVCLGADGNEIEPDTIENGDYVRLEVFYGKSKKFRVIYGSLVGVQLFAKGESLGGSGSSKPQGLGNTGFAGVETSDTDDEGYGNFSGLTSIPF